MSIHQPLLYFLTPVSYSIEFFSYMKTPENTDEDSDDPKAADEGNIQMESPSA
jgi:hypothetical protein